VISLKVFGDCFGIEMDSLKISGMVKNCSSSVSRSMVGFCCVFLKNEKSKLLRERSRGAWREVGVDSGNFKEDRRQLDIY